MPYGCFARRHQDANLVLYHSSQTPFHTHYSFRYTAASRARSSRDYPRGGNLKRRISEALIHGSNAYAPLAWATYIAFALALFPAFGALADSIKNHQWVGTAFYGVFLVALAFLAYTQIRRHKPVVLPPANVFHPFLALTELDAWPRPAELDSIVDTLNRSSNVVPLVVGPSGSGKTVLLHRLLLDHLTEISVPCEYFDEYSGFRERLISILKHYKIAAGRDRRGEHEAKPIIILDQFEQYLGQLRQLTPDRRERERCWLKQVIETNKFQGNCRFLISIRNEWYYDLRWLGDIIPAPINCTSIAGPRADAEDDVTRMAIAGRLAQVLNSDEVVESVLATLGRGTSGQLLLLETQIIGAVLERDKLLGRKIDSSYITDKLGGIEGAIDKYFEGILQGAPDRRVTLKVLCALSVRTYFRRQEDMTDLLDRLFEDTDDVREALEYLSSQHLVIMRPTARYELAHDYLAEYFHQKSGSELDPTDRDNVLYHFEGNASEVNDFVRLKADESQRQRGVFAFVIIGPLVLLMTLRLIDFGIVWPGPHRFLTQHLLWGDRFFDAAYLPIYVAHLSWSIYVALLYSRLFSQLNEHFLDRLFSRFVVLNMAACVVTAMFVPYVWLASIGWGGIVVGLKLLTISRARQINGAARARFMLFGSITIFNLIFLLVLGVIGMLVSFRYITNESSGNLWIYISCLFSLIVTYACGVLAPVHVQRKGVSQLLGLLARLHTSSAPSLSIQ
jgi:hypothetical protein